MRAFRRVPYGYTPQLMALVGMQTPGMMVPGGGGAPWDPRIALYHGGGGGPLGNPVGTPPPGACGPFYPPNCSPCPPDPQQAAYEQAAYAAACQQNQELLMRAARIEAMGKLPTKVLGCNSPEVTAAGVTTRNVAGFATVSIPVTPSVVACITDWTIADVSFNFFEIISATAAMTTYLGSDGSVPASSFKPEGTHPVMDWPTLWPGTFLTVTVRNTTADPHEFRSTFHFIRGMDPGSCLR